MVGTARKAMVSAAITVAVVMLLPAIIPYAGLCGKLRTRCKGTINDHAGYGPPPIIQQLFQGLFQLSN